MSGAATRLRAHPARSTRPRRRALTGAVTILAALLSGAFGAWLTSWNNRRERYRDRLIEAADDFATATSEALIKARGALEKFEHSASLEEQAQAVETALDYRDVALQKSARVTLLFGDSEARAPVGRILHLLSVMAGLLIPDPDPTTGERPPSDLAGARKAHLDAAWAFEGGFLEQAHAEIRIAAPPSETIRQSLRRVLKRNRLPARSD